MSTVIIMLGWWGHNKKSCLEFLDSDYKIICSKVKEKQNYMTIFENRNYELTIEEILAKCN